MNRRGHELAAKGRGRSQADDAIQFPAAAGRQFLHFFQHAQRHARPFGDGGDVVRIERTDGVARRN